LGPINRGLVHTIEEVVDKLFEFWTTDGGYTAIMTAAFGQKNLNDRL
jgi:hypothetical protein